MVKIREKRTAMTFCNFTSIFISHVSHQKQKLIVKLFFNFFFENIFLIPIPLVNVSHFITLEHRLYFRSIHVFSSFLTLD